MKRLFFNVFLFLGTVGYANAGVHVMQGDSVTFSSLTVNGPIGITSTIFQSSVTIAVNTTWTGDRYIPLGSTITINSGVTLTINGSISAGPYQIFTGPGLVQFGSSFQGKVFPEWWGGTLAGGTDDALAVSSAAASLIHGGIVQLIPRSYTFKTGVTVTNHSVTIQGTAIGPSPYDSGGGLVNGTQIVGTNGVYGFKANAVDYFTLQDLDISLPVGASVISTAVIVTGSFDAKILNIRTTNYSKGIYVSNSTDIYLERNYLSAINVTTPLMVGIEIDGTNHIQVASIYINNNIAAGSSGGTFYPYWLHGNRVADAHFTNDEGDGGTAGFYIDCTAGLDQGLGGDIFINSCAADTNVTYGYYINGCGQTAAMNITNSWAASGTYGVFVGGSTNINVNNTQIYGSGSAGIYVQLSTGTSLTGNQILFTNAVGNGIVLDNSPSSQVIGNTIAQKDSGNTTAINVLTGSTGAVIVGNLAFGPTASFANGIAMGSAGIDGAVVIGNRMPSGIITTPYTFNLLTNTNTITMNQGSTTTGAIVSYTLAQLATATIPDGTLVNCSNCVTDRICSSSGTIGGFTRLNARTTACQ